MTTARQRVFTGRTSISHPQLERKVVRAMLLSAPEILATNLIGRVATTLDNTEHRASSVTVTFKGLSLKLKRRIDNAVVGSRSQRTTAGFWWESFYDALHWTDNELSTFDADALDDSVANNTIAYLNAASEKQIEGISRALLSNDSRSIEPDESRVIPFFADNHEGFWDRREFSNRAESDAALVVTDRIEEQALALQNDVSNAIFALGDNGLKGPLIGMDDMKGQVLAICHSQDTFKPLHALATKSQMGQNGGWMNDLAGTFTARWNRYVEPPEDKKNHVHFLIMSPGGYPVIPIRSGGTAEAFERSPLMQIVTSPPDVKRIDNAVQPGEQTRSTYVEVDLSFGFRTTFAERAYQLEIKTPAP